MVEEAENKSKISIWWDIENCHVPKDVDPHCIAKNMTAALQRARLTGPIEIQVFGDTKILPDVTQRALSDTGITLNHVPGGNKEAADKAILVAMLLWALDNPPPANILLISGDGDFANALNRLGLKTYNILLAVPAQFVKPALTGAAKKLWFWKEMANGQLAEPELSRSSSNASLQELTGSGRTMNNFQRQGSSSFKEYASPKKKISESKGANTTEHFGSLSLNAGMSSDNSNKSRGTENGHNAPSDRNVSPGGAGNISVSNKPNANAGQSQQHVSGSSNESSNSVGCSPGGVSNISASNKLNANSGPSQQHVMGLSNSAAPSMDFGQYPYFLPQAGEIVESLEPMTSSAPCNNKEESRPPQYPNMPRGPLKHIAPNNNRGANKAPPSKNTAPENKADLNVHSHKQKASEHGNSKKNKPRSSRPAASMPPPSNVTMSNPEKMPHETCLDKIYCAMKTLERDMLAPTESNLSECIRYWDSQHEKVDVKQTLDKAAELQQVTKTQLGGGLVMFFPPEHRVPWTCVDPGNMQYNHSSDVWSELQRFLLYGEKNQSLLFSGSRYDAALTLKNACSMHIQSLHVGQILNLLQQAMQEKKWLKKNGPGWAPLVLNQKALQNEAQKGEPSTSQGNPGRISNPVQPANAERMLDKDVILGKLRGFLSQILKDNTVLNLSFLPKEFERATGMPLDYQKLGYANLQYLMKELTDVAYVETTNSGVSLLRLAKINGNMAGLVDTKMSGKENDVKALRQGQVVRELKSWLSYLMTSVNDGYDISRVHQDFFQASGKDLSKEGFDFSKLQCILKQFSDIIYIVRSSGGLWLAYPVIDGTNSVSKSASSVAVSTS